VARGSVLSKSPPDATNPRPTRSRSRKPHWLAERHLRRPGVSQQQFRPRLRKLSPPQHVGGPVVGALDLVLWHVPQDQVRDLAVLGEPRRPSPFVQYGAERRAAASPALVVGKSGEWVWGDALRYTISPLLGRAMTKAAYKAIFYPAPVPQSWTRNFPREMAMRPSQLRAVSADGAVMVPCAAKLSKRYPELEVPITIIVGDGDTIADPDEQSVRLHSDVPHSRLLVLDDVGHMVQHTKGDQVIDAILSGEHLL